MSDTPVTLAPRASDRLTSLAVAGGALSVLAVSAWLEPDPAGHGTHQQLGLSPCTFLTLTGLPCPMCGATTTFALMAHGRVLDGVANHPVAALLFVVCLFTVGVAGAEALAPRGRWDTLVRVLESRQLRLSALFMVAIMAGWTYSIAMRAGIF